MQQLSDVVIAPSEFADTEVFAQEELKRRVKATLQNRIPNLPPVEITVVGRTVVFHGELSAEQQWLCHEHCRHVPGVLRVMEKVVVPETRTI